KLRHGHEFEQRDSGFCQLRQNLTRGVPGSFLREGSDMHFVNHLFLDANAVPSIVFPAIRRWADDLRKSMGTLWLNSGCGIGDEQVAMIKSNPVMHSGSRRIGNT